MFKRIAKLVFASSTSPFESYYGRLLLQGPREGVPHVREAQQDFRASSKTRVPGQPI